MPLHTTDALILRTYKLGESDRIVVFLTRDRGKKRGVAKNARQSRRRCRGGVGGGRGAARVRTRRLLRAGAPGTRPPRLRRAAAVAVVVAQWRGAGLRGVFCRAHRRVGAGRGSKRDAVPARRIDGRGDGPGSAHRASRALLRVLAAAAPGRLRRRQGNVESRAGISRRRARVEPAGARWREGVAAHVARTGSRASRADRGAPRKGSEVRARAAGHETMTTKRTAAGVS